MQCPVDNTRLTISERQGVEIDYCPTCRGVWLDRGELDKLIARDSEFDRRDEYRDDSRTRRDYDDDDDDYRSNHDGRSQKRHKKEGFLGDLFDF